jgi:hypothetical protein
LDAEKKKVQQKIAEKEKPGEEIKLWQSVERIACKYINKEHFKRTEYTFTVNDGSKYFEWMSFLMGEYL